MKGEIQEGAALALALHHFVHSLGGVGCVNEFKLQTISMMPVERVRVEPRNPFEAVRNSGDESVQAIGFGS